MRWDVIKEFLRERTKKANKANKSVQKDIKEGRFLVEAASECSDTETRSQPLYNPSFSVITRKMDYFLEHWALMLNVINLSCRIQQVSQFILHFYTGLIPRKIHVRQFKWVIWYWNISIFPDLQPKHSKIFYPSRHPSFFHHNFNEWWYFYIFLYSVKFVLLRCWKQGT